MWILTAYSKLSNCRVNFKSFLIAGTTGSEFLGEHRRRILQEDEKSVNGDFVPAVFSPS
jgi:hypothetical protein